MVRTIEAHAVAVEVIATRTRALHESRTPFRIFHGSTNSTRRSQRSIDNIVDTSKLNNVLRVDKDRKTITVEPNVSMGSLVEETIKHGMVPLVVMEFPGITVGGGFSGTSGESSSFRYGAFDSTINEIEIVLANGDVTRATKTGKQDLFWGAASAFGTLGIVTLLEVQLRDAKKYVQLTYQLSPSIAQTSALLQQEISRETNDYVDAITFSLDSTVICIGCLVDEVPDRALPCQFLRSRDPWFYLHVQRAQRGLEKSATTITDFVPLVDYLFRYDRGAFWTGRYAFKYFITPFNRITRFLLDPFMHTSVMYRALHPSGLADFYMVQDVGIPYDKAEEFTLWLEEHHLKLYPLWLCPLRLRRDSPNSHHGLHSEFADPAAPDLLNFGVWGPLSFNRREAVRQNRALELKVHQLGGKKWLYAHAYYTEDEFWDNYDRKSYDALRSKYYATHLPSVYDKVKVDADAEEAAIHASWTAWLLALFWCIWPLRGLYGVYKVIVGGDHLVQKTANRNMKERKER
ncbi:hypothetical protein MMC10_004644 [Thelotrema lepadinum]|nr:hypothetical protein [Thelotrema lepadinum]